MITGANVGIGFETAKELLIRGGKVIILCRNEEKMLKAKEELQKSAIGQGFKNHELGLKSDTASESMFQAKLRLMEF